MLNNEILLKAKKNKPILIDRLEKFNIFKLYPDGKPVLRISEAYNGLWLEHAYDAVVFSELFPEKSNISLNQINTFLDYQLENGHIPYSVRTDGVNVFPRYHQIQECISFVQVCLKAVKQNNCDKTEIKRIYDALCKWDNWYETYRTNKNGLILTYCGFDTGHDNSSRLKDYGKYVHNFEPTGCALPEDSQVLPVISPDLNAVVYGNKMGLKEFAEILGLYEDSTIWEQKAVSLKQKLLKTCYDEKSDFFYDVDKNGEFIPIKSISVTSLFAHKVLDKNYAKEFFVKYFKDKNYFGTDYPYPSVAVCDKAFKKNLNGNSWNYYSQGLTALRTTLWMEEYGFTKEFEYLLKKWVYALTTHTEKNFPQELDPFTGIPSSASEYYSSSMLLYLYALKKFDLSL